MLRLAHRWQSDSIVDLVTNTLPRIASLVDQIALARQYELSGIIGPAARLLCIRAEPLSLTETRRLGADAGHAIWRLRERYRSGWNNRAAVVQEGDERLMQAFDELKLDST